MMFITVHFPAAGDTADIYGSDKLSYLPRMIFFPYLLPLCVLSTGCLFITVHLLRHSEAAGNQEQIGGLMGGRVNH